VSGRIRTLGLLYLLLLCTIPLGAQAQGVGEWQCTVENFTTFDEEDAAFIEKNLRKKFILTVTQLDILVEVTSEDFGRTEDRYSFFFSGSWASYARIEGPAYLDTISLPRDPSRKIEENGYFNATMTIQSDFYVNSWLLRCGEPEA
jgi:hypothetical protein